MLDWPSCGTVTFGSQAPHVCSCMRSTPSGPRCFGLENALVTFGIQASGGFEFGAGLAVTRCQEAHSSSCSKPGKAHSFSSIAAAPTGEPNPEPAGLFLGLWRRLRFVLSTGLAGEVVLPGLRKEPSGQLCTLVYSVHQIQVCKGFNR